MNMQIHFLQHNGSSCVATLPLTGPVPRVGELITIPPHLREAMERHDVAIVAHVHYRIEGGRTVPELTAIASHDSSAHRLQLLEECGWLNPQP